MSPSSEQVVLAFFQLLYGAFCKSEVKFYRICIQNGLDDPQIEIIHNAFTEKQRRHRRRNKTSTIAKDIISKFTKFCQFGNGQ